jgi:hypothetical protein
MALHPVKLPRSAGYLFRVVVLQKRLLKALADPDLNADAVDTAWVQNVWRPQDAEWVRKFCLGGRESVLHPLRAIAAAPLVARQSLYSEFCRQNKIAAMLDAGGNFKYLNELPGFTPELATMVTKFFKRCYELLGADTYRKWTGYEFSGSCSISNRRYKEDFCSDYPTKVVCPYCDGEIGSPELDHYLSKSEFPLLACSPWNLVPVCRSCNDLITAKGDRPAITLGPPHSTDDWLHPFFRPASALAQIRLTGTPEDSIPRLHSPDAAEQTRLENHTGLIRSLSKHWTNTAAGYFDRLVWHVNRNAGNHVNMFILARNIANKRLEEHTAFRGRAASSMIHAAVCRAVLDRRPEYIQEFLTPNAPKLV